MSAHFRISVRFLDGEFHGRGDNSEPEWPPSPLRLFQALTNAAGRLNSNSSKDEMGAALRWLEALKRPPEILAVEATSSTGYKLYVPNNVGDLVAKQWSAEKYFERNGHPIDISAYRTDKYVRPLRLAGDGSVHYLWPLEAEEVTKYQASLITIVRAISHLGWGVDLVVSDAAVEQSCSIESLRTYHSTLKRWLPVENSGGSSLRVPISGSLEALETRYIAFLGRLPTDDDGNQYFRPVPPLKNFRAVTYRQETELSRPPYAVFALRKPDDSGFATFDPQWRRLHLTGMLRHSASQPDFASALGWDKEKVNTFVLGHDMRDPNCEKPSANDPRLVFVPLPSIEWQGEGRGNTVGAIRRVLVTARGNLEAREFQRIVRALEGRELIDERSLTPVAFLCYQSHHDRAISGYFNNSSAWTTVTPVILPGHDDPRKLRRRLREIAPPLTAAEKEHIVRKLDSRIERLLRKAFIDSGMPAPLVADAELQWRETGFMSGADLVSRYSTPDQCRRFRRLHVWVVWRERLPDGTFRPKELNMNSCVGSGRFSGLGLFTPVT